MRILVIGSGGREHAVCEKFYQSEKVAKIFAMPGNAGISSIAECIANINISDNQAIIGFCQAQAIDLVFVGPEQPLVDGLVDDLEKAGLRAFGPSKYCAQLEGSKAFMKKIAADNNVPTAAYQVFTNSSQAIEFAKKLGFPCVIKADGLAAGKGVVIAQDLVETEKTLTEFFAGKFGEASKKIIIEAFLEGVEVSHFALCDGSTNFISLGFACDHKKVGENETGPNTGGMGTFSPSPFVTAEIEKIILEKIVTPTLDAMSKLGHPFKGILFGGIILTKNGPKLLEFNTRFGDPETQVILPRIKTDFVDLINAAVDGNLSQIKIEFDEAKKLVCVVMCANGYPETYQKGTEINLDATKNLRDVKILHAGTAIKNNKLVANGGRVLNIVASAQSFKDARNKAYEAVDLIDWKDGFVRRDIAQKVE
ncbi:MAG: phosphoribosylamine--glycine ligase [Rickettsiales bacterium]|nr:phosphoribosylamine--glycine ligase [Rickettsiales bacterium]